MQDVRARDGRGSLKNRKGRGSAWSTDLSFIGLSARCLLSCSNFVGDVVRHGALQLVEDGEGQSDVKDDPDESWSNTHVESFDTLLLVNLFEAVGEAIVLVRVDALHLGLHNIDGVVGHGGAESGEATRQEVNGDLDGDVVGKSLLGVLKHDESHTLVR